MIRLRDVKGKTKDINVKEFPFIEILDLDNNVIAAFIINDGSILKIDIHDKESIQYKNLFNVNFSKKIQKKHEQSN